MAEPSKQTEEQTDTEEQTSTPGLDRLEKLANAAATADQERKWRAKKSGFQAEVEASDVRSLNHDADARAQAEAAMQKMMAQPRGKQRKW